MFNPRALLGELQLALALLTIGTWYWSFKTYNVGLAYMAMLGTAIVVALSLVTGLVLIADALKKRDKDDEN